MLFHFIAAAAATQIATFESNQGGCQWRLHDVERNQTREVRTTPTCPRDVLWSASTIDYVDGKSLTRIGGATIALPVPIDEHTCGPRLALNAGSPEVHWGNGERARLVAGRWKRERAPDEPSFEIAEPEQASEDCVFDLPVNKDTFTLQGKAVGQPSRDAALGPDDPLFAQLEAQLGRHPTGFDRLTVDQTRQAYRPIVNNAYGNVRRTGPFFVCNKTCLKIGGPVLGERAPHLQLGLPFALVDEKRERGLYDLRTGKRVRTFGASAVVLTDAEAKRF